AMRSVLQSLALEGDDALIASHVAARLDAESQMAAAEEIVARRARAPALIETRQRPEIRRRVEVDEQHGNRSVAFRLQLEAALELQRRAEQRGEDHRLGKLLRDRLGVVV